MNDRLGRLAARALGDAPSVQPAIPPRYAPAAPAAPLDWPDDDERRGPAGESPGAEPPPEPVEVIVALPRRDAVADARTAEATPTPAGPPASARTDLVRATAPRPAATARAKDDVERPPAPLPARTARGEPDLAAPWTTAAEPADATASAPRASDAPPVPRERATARVPAEPAPPVPAAVARRAPTPLSAPASVREHHAPTPQPVRIHIGRIEVRAVPPPAAEPRPPRPAPPPRVALADYLRRHGADR